jgi:hypothetical protein
MSIKAFKLSWVPISKKLRSSMLRVSSGFRIISHPEPILEGKTQQITLGLELPRNYKLGLLFPQDSHVTKSDYIIERLL